MKKWLLLAIAAMLLTGLSGCGKSVEEQINVGVASAQTVFEETPREPNKKIGQIELYLPSGYSIKETDDVNNYVISKGKDNYILFVNVNEKEDSKLHYELLKKNSAKKIVKEQPVELDGVFGFTMVIKHNDDQYELIASSGGVKLSTISNGRNMDDKLVEMMMIARSVEVIR
ncbi:hypothetical protein NST62_08900 [Ureibacillus sp. FSL K6-8385]|uniref:DUF4367 domain-containing protein n=1 Tax=Ureibacillus terrenus TaxID=118246 RepID=A0A540V0H0_9BACL|nr:hypothetical protein [Ureibacillus terrenus]MED3662519.1 hypothetical protein [Ureibacillus terrenus]MED3764833.1 hypothetical protein [Ureibacillus terrenus]TQE90187.1 hypothetical protein FKZ59_11085 [Ureibacillus terrenus]